MIKNKIIIYGYTDFSREFIKILKEKDYELLVVESDLKLFQQAINDQKDALHLSLLNDDEFLQIGLDSPHVKSFVVASNHKTNNLFVTLSARNFNKDLSIICLSESEHEDSQLMLAGASAIVNPSHICGSRIARVITKPKIINILDEILFGKSTLNLYEYQIGETSKLNGKLLSDVEYDKFNLLILGLRDNELSEKFIFGNLGINHKLDSGDVLVFIGEKKDFESFKISSN